MSGLNDIFHRHSRKHKHGSLHGSAELFVAQGTHPSANVENDISELESSSSGSKCNTSTSMAVNQCLNKHDKLAIPLLHWYVRILSWSLKIKPA